MSTVSSCIGNNAEIRLAGGVETSYPTAIVTAFYTSQQLGAIQPCPRLMATSPRCASAIGVNVDSLRIPSAVGFLSGAQLHATAHPYAHNYAGHQFGIYAGQLGDGRCVTLGEVAGTMGGRWAVQIKGCGPTVFSRGGDGYVALRSCVIEFLMSEYLAAIGVPTTRSLAVVSTSRLVRRNRVGRVGGIDQVSRVDGVSKLGGIDGINRPNTADQTLAATTLATIPVTTHKATPVSAATSLPSPTPSLTQPQPQLRSHAIPSIPSIPKSTKQNPQYLIQQNINSSTPSHNTSQSVLQPSGILTRISPTWIRFGSFELWHYRDDRARVQQLADYCIQSIYPESLTEVGKQHLIFNSIVANQPISASTPGETVLQTPPHPTDACSTTSQEEPSKSYMHASPHPQKHYSERSTNIFKEVKVPLNQYAIFFRMVVKRTAAMVASWQAAGFVHGMLSSGFLDAYNPEHTPNRTDDDRQYRFEMQPLGVQWNLIRLGRTLASLMGKPWIPYHNDQHTLPTHITIETACESAKTINQHRASTAPSFQGKRQAALGVVFNATHGENIAREIAKEFQAYFLTEFTTIMCKKIGLVQSRDTDLDQLITPLLQIMAETGVDYTLFMRSLCYFKCDDSAFALQTDYDPRGRHSGDQLSAPVCVASEPMDPLTLLLRSLSRLHLEEATVDPASIDSVLTSDIGNSPLGVKDISGASYDGQRESVLEGNSVNAKEFAPTQHASPIGSESKFSTPNLGENRLQRVGSQGVSILASIDNLLGGAGSEYNDTNTARPNTESIHNVRGNAIENSIKISRTSSQTTSSNDNTVSPTMDTSAVLPKYFDARSVDTRRISSNLSHLHELPPLPSPLVPPLLTLSPDYPVHQKQLDAMPHSLSQQKPGSNLTLEPRSGTSDHNNVKHHPDKAVEFKRASSVVYPLLTLEETAATWSHWAQMYRSRILSESVKENLELTAADPISTLDSHRTTQMRHTNPRYTMRGWVVDAVVTNIESECMALNAKQNSSNRRGTSQQVGNADTHTTKASASTFLKDTKLSSNASIDLCRTATTEWQGSSQNSIDRQIVPNQQIGTLSTTTRTLQTPTKAIHTGHHDIGQQDMDDTRKDYPQAISGVPRSSEISSTPLSVSPFTSPLGTVADSLDASSTVASSQLDAPHKPSHVNGNPTANTRSTSESEELMRVVRVLIGDVWGDMAETGQGWTDIADRLAAEVWADQPSIT
ncbi:hypothetical protein BASA81_011420 [Batrachochytrium salamandrivorans]|nr:hypothetical protein BASA81_011420 [Batrachochytrium salamandrivorans]